MANVWMMALAIGRSDQTRFSPNTHRPPDGRPPDNTELTPKKQTGDCGEIARRGGGGGGMGGEHSPQPTHYRRAVEKHRRNNRVWRRNRREHGITRTHTHTRSPRRASRTAPICAHTICAAPGHRNQRQSGRVVLSSLSRARALSLSLSFERSLPRSAFVRSARSEPGQWPMRAPNSRQRTAFTAMR